MKHHYVPAFYLGAFTDPATPASYEPYLWVVDLEQRSISRRAPKNAAARTDYYAPGGESGGTDHCVETWFSQIESVVKPTIERILQGDTVLDTSERKTLANFIALQIVRVPSFREPVEEFVAQIGKICSALMLKDREGWDQSVRATYPSREFSSEELDRQYVWASNPNNYQIRANPKFVLGAGLRAAPDVANVIKCMSLSFMTSPPERTFWTSDAPVSWINPKSSSPFFGLKSRDVELSCPLGPQVCLLANWVSAFGARIQLNDDALLYRNQGTIARAKFAFCNSEAAAQDVLKASCPRTQTSSRPARRDISD